MGAVYSTGADGLFVWCLTAAKSTTTKAMATKMIDVAISEFALKKLD